MKYTSILVNLFCGIGVIYLSACGGNSATTETQAPAPKSMISEEPEPADPMENIGIGPITSVELGDIDANLAEEGKVVFDNKCSACHKVGKRFVGPDPAGIMERRSPEWIMNMILNPEEMVKSDPIAKDLLKEYLSPMANQSLTEQEARSILEYFRTI